MTKIKFFYKQDCPKCPAAKAQVSKLPNVEFFSLDEVDGLAEAAYYSVMATPSVVISSQDGAELASFRGAVPAQEVLKQWA